MSERTLSELANGEIVPDMGGPNAWLVRFDEGDYDTVNKSGKNTLLLKGDVQVDDTVSYGGIMVDFNLQRDDITLHDGENEVRVPDAKHENVLWAVYESDGPRLNKLFDELYTPTVRQGLMDMLMPRFRDGDVDINKADDGWLVDSDVLVSWEASNHPVNVEQAHIVRGSSTVEADEDKEALEITFRGTDGGLAVDLPNGTRTTLDEVEAEFLTTVALVLGDDYTGGNLYDDALQTAIEESSVNAFTDPRSGLHHNHDRRKHTLSMLDVTEEAQDRLWYNEYDHTGVWEMAVRRDEFENAPIDVFENVPNDNSQKWSKIESTKSNAPIPQHVRSDLEERYEA